MRKVRDKEVFIFSTEGHQYFFIEFKSALKGLINCFLELKLLRVHHRLKISLYPTRKQRDTRESLAVHHHSKYRL